MNKRKIAIFTTSFLPTIGGLQYETKWLLDSMDKLIDNGYENLELSFFAPNKESLGYAKFRNIKVTNLKLGYSKVHIAGNIFKLRTALNVVKPDLLHCQGVTPDGLLVYLNNLISLRKQKYIVTSHGEDIAVIPEINYGLRLSPAINYLTRLVLKGACKHTTLSKAMKDFAIDAGSEENKIAIIPDGLEPVNKKVSIKIKEQIMKKFHIGKEDLCMLSLSGMRPVKGINNLVDGFSKAYSVNRHLRLFLACHGLETKRLKERVEKLNLTNNIHFIGFIEGEEKKVYFDICDMYCNTALFEPFGIALLEAMEYGLIVLGSVEGGIKDYIKDGYNGFLISPKDTHRIAEVILKVYEDEILRKKISENAQRSVKTYYIDNIARKYLDLYSEALE